MSSEAEHPGLKLLALDGGGIRGLSELLMIKEVMHRLMLEENKKRKTLGLAPLDTLPKPCDHFDLIGGTSTGGIIALMLGRLRMDVDTAIMCYDHLAKEVFSEVKRGLGDRKFKASKLEEVIKCTVAEMTGDSETPLLEHGEDFCRTFVCARNAQNMNANIPVLFRTYDSHETHTGCKIWEAARATSAAPTFFKRIEIGRGQQHFIDGGLGSNNPSKVVLDEAKKVFPNRQIGCIVSIGTGQVGTISIDRPGFLQHLIPTDVIEALQGIATDCEAKHEEMLALFDNSPNTYFRLNVDQGMQNIKLSEWEKLSNVEAHTAQYMRRKEVEKTLTLLVNVMGTHRGQLTIEQLISPKPPIQSTGYMEDRKHCPPPVLSFTGRNDILQKMYSYFDDDRGSAQHIFVLHGLGGAGKSQLAFKFVHDSQANHRFSEIFYIDATNEQTLEIDLQAVAPAAAGKSAQASRQWLAGRQAEQKEWLLFFDNADDVEVDISKFFPRCTFGNILITTRNQDLCLHARDEDTVSKVSNMIAEDAKDLLLRLAGEGRSNQQEKLAGAIVKELNCFALAVAQAGGYIHTRSNLREYLELYQNHRDRLLRRTEIQGLDQYGRAVYATWDLSYGKLSSAGQTLLQICSILHHEGISEHIFQKAATAPQDFDDSDVSKEVTLLLNQLGKRDEEWDSLAFREVMGELESYSLIERDRQAASYAIHPLVQHWSGATMGTNKYAMQKCVLTIISSSITGSFKDEDYKYRQKLLLHAARSTHSLNPDQLNPLVAARIALVYGEGGRWNDAEPLLVAVMETHKRVLGKEHPETLMSINNLALTYRNQGRWNDAEPLQVAVMETSKRVLGEDHPSTLTRIANLASTYSDQGRWKDAEALGVAVMETSKRVLGEEHPDTLTSIANLASTYHYQGRWNDAEVLEVAVVETSKRVLGEEHPDTLTRIGNLALTYWNQGRWNDAEVLEVAVVETSKCVLGEEHPDTLASIANLASTYWNQGRWNDAEVLEVVVMEASKRVLGEEHPNTLTRIGNLALTYWNQGRWNDAEALQVAVIETSKRVLGEEHPDTLTRITNLASMYQNQGGT
ncbi:acyl transferase/acyl hydrolase/lysophospholipase [Mycena alexandri]|uniref:Acyl transferase/acyl hydrolase/lysophospholipase n=1 Tax=Mycena alexandri TaxID=1745969 RepID=A0AAD6STV9_9AGAR|nr:acyl transferase/acyl hydrolase/lysophospholipase [Mycena alexandri]